MISLFHCKELPRLCMQGEHDKPNHPEEYGEGCHLHVLSCGACRSTLVVPYTFKDVAVGQKVAQSGERSQLLFFRWATPLTWQVLSSL